MATSRHTPFRARVSEVVESRYSQNKKPLSWDDRQPGVDLVRTTDGETLKLVSDGGQSPPKVGWEILLMGGDSHSGYRWTLYGIA